MYEAEIPNWSLKQILSRFTRIVATCPQPIGMHSRSYGMCEERQKWNTLSYKFASKWYTCACLQGQIIIQWLLIMYSAYAYPVVLLGWPSACWEMCSHTNVHIRKNKQPPSSLATHRDHTAKAVSDKELPPSAATDREPQLRTLPY